MPHWFDSVIGGYYWYYAVREELMDVSYGTLEMEERSKQRKKHYGIAGGYTNGGLKV